MLTGPVTILQWSFVRDDHAAQRGVPPDRAGAPRRSDAIWRRPASASSRSTSRRCAKACRCGRPSGQPISDWAVECFPSLPRPALRDETQIHTHMCYSEFNDIIDAIAAMDADVISIETVALEDGTARRLHQLSLSERNRPGRLRHPCAACATVDEMVALLDKAQQRLSPDQIWVNPDCGLKTRKWDEVRPALINMVHAARRIRGSAK